MPIVNDQQEEIVHQDQEIVHQQEEIVNQDQEIVNQNQQPIMQNNQHQKGNGTVTVIDGKSPIVFLFGPPSSGKTMTLVRLYRYFINLDTRIEAETSFVTGDGGDYERRCTDFPNDAMSDYAAERTEGMAFMLLNIWKDTKKVCQILESPGERLFHPDPEQDKFPVHYVSSIIKSKNKKIYVFYLQPNWGDSAIRNRYVQRIAKVANDMESGRDKVIFLYNKIDESPALGKFGKVNMDTLINEINNSYPGLLNLFKNSNPITKISKPYLCYLVPFQTGDYSADTQATRFTAGDDKYPQELWKTIQKCL